MPSPINIELLPRPCLILQQDGYILQVNRLAATLLGVSRKELIGRNMAALLTQYDSQPFIKLLNRILPDQPEHWLAHLVDKATIRYFQMDISRLPDSSLLTIFDDITVREEEESKKNQHINTLENLCRLSPVAMLLVNNSLKIRSFNLAFQQIWDAPSTIKVGQDIREAMRLISRQVKEPAPFSGIIQQVLNQHLTQINDTVELKDGRTFHISTHPVMETNNILGRVWYFQDISALKEMQDQLASQQIFQNAILEHIEDGIVACDANGELSMFNRASRELHGLEANIPDHDLWVEHYRLFHADGITPLQPVDIPLIKALNGIQLKNEEMVIVLADGTKRDVQVSGQVMFDKKGAKMGAVVSLHDITDLKRVREQLREIAYQDPLTGMPNRRLFHDLLQQALHLAKRGKESVGVLFLDLDNFKSVNDQLGHDTGDQLLKDISTTLTSCLRESDVICRWGGDEFVIALTNIAGEDDARLVATKICDAIAGALEGKYDNCWVSTSIGIAMYPEHAGIPDLLIRSADKAMYEAKQQGKNRFCFALPHTSLPELSHAEQQTNN